MKSAVWEATQAGSIIHFRQRCGLFVIGQTVLAEDLIDHGQFFTNKLYALGINVHESVKDTDRDAKTHMSLRVDLRSRFERRQQPQSCMTVGDEKNRSRNSRTIIRR